MKVIGTEIEGLFILEPDVFGDERGYFFESYNEAKMKKAGLDYNFIQDNQSFSKYGTVRGLHMQKGAFSQAKLVRVLKGKVLDVAVDGRKGSKTYGKHIAVELSAENKRQLLIPREFLHGFSVLSDEAEFFYKCDNVYNKESEVGVKFDDIDLGIDWRIEKGKEILSEKDKTNICWKDF